MKKTAERIENCIQQDPGNRGLDKWAYKGDLLPAAQSLFQGNHVIIATGFYILDAQVVETDGPPGTVVLARALRQLGKRVCLLVDDHSKSILEE
ncbi:MAG: DUF4392 domain-containing protein, partial [Proteobacteria bacterium]|nr:DUF4392 domain-containing protein [Pseudomonadota bacterium]